MGTGKSKYLEDMLYQQMLDQGLSPKREYRFHPKRKFLADFVLVEDLIIIEANGGTWIPKSGHTSGYGIQRDYHKGNIAQSMGYVYLQYTAKDIKDGYAIKEILEFVKRRRHGHD